MQQYEQTFRDNAVDARCSASWPPTAIAIYHRAVGEVVRSARGLPYLIGAQTNVARAGNSSGQYCRYQSVLTDLASVSGAHSCCAATCTWSRLLTRVS